jgi:probable F420-dependent oxidoreductase
MRVMRIGLALPHYDFSFPDGAPLTWPRLVDAARRAEALGFDSVWISDHFFFDAQRYGGAPGPVATVEPFTALAAVAAATERVRLGTLVACAPFRHPAHVAKMATTIDLLSGGRFELGLGAGWFQTEFEAFGYQYGATGDRFGLLEEQVEVIAGLFGGGPVDHQGDRYQLRGAFNHPRPAKAGGPPIWLGGKGGERLLRLVVRSGAGWNTVWRWRLDDYQERATALRKVCEAEGREPSAVPRSLGLYTLVGEDEADLASRWRDLQRWTPNGALDSVSLDAYAADTLTGTAAACLDTLAAYAHEGVEEFVVCAASLPFAVYDWSMVELIAGSIVPAAHELAPGR